MRSNEPFPILRRNVVRVSLLVLALLALALLGAWLLQRTIPRHIVLASGVADGMYHEFALRYRAIPARDGVTVEERMTAGAGDNAALLLDPKSGVDVAFMQGGVVPAAGEGNLVMLAALYYEPLWIFYRATDNLSQLDDLRFKRVADGAPGSGVLAFMDPLLAANNVTGFNTQLLPLANLDAMHALQAGRVDAAVMVGAVKSPAIWQALHDPNLKLMSLGRADAYPRRFSYISKLTLPAGTIDFALHIPDRNVDMIGTKAMLASRADLSPAIVNLLVEAARELHGEQGYFEAGSEFPNATPVDLPVSTDAERHFRFGPSFLQRYLPFFVATYLERLIVLLVPLLVVVVPLSNVLPRLLSWRVRSRVYRWYGELSLLERDVEQRRGKLPIDRWLADLDRIEQGAARIRTPASFASEAYTLREHIALVRRTVMARDAGMTGD